MLSSADNQRLETAYLRKSPMQILAVAGGIVCALLLAIFIWNIRAYSFGIWRLDMAAIWTAFFSAPIAVLLWAILPMPDSRPRTYVWLRHFIRLHIVLTALVILTGCTPMGRMLSLSPVWSLYGLLGFGAVFVDLLVLLIAPTSTADPDDIAIYARWQRRLAGGLALAIIAWSFLNIGLMSAQAQYIAAGRPYCIQVASDGFGRYRPVGSLMEMNGLKMYTPHTNSGGSSDFQFAFHAVLSVEREYSIEWRHWSYWQQRFVPFKNTSAWPASLLIREGKRCERKSNFALGLPPI